MKPWPRPDIRQPHFYPSCLPGAPSLCSATDSSSVGFDVNGALPPEPCDVKDWINVVPSIDFPSVWLPSARQAVLRFDCEWLGWYKEFWSYPSSVGICLLRQET